jgi:hypothetical protein
VEGNVELVCPHVADTEKPLPGTSASVDRNILHPLQVGLKERKRRLDYASRSP